jgi:subtilisin family serine protease
MLSLALLVLFASVTLTVRVLAEKNADTIEREAAFARKADPLLREVRRASESDRAAIERGERPAGAASSEVSRLSKAAGVRRDAEGRLTVGVNVLLASESAEELKAAGFKVGAIIGDVATVETEPERLPELASLASVRKLSAATFMHVLNDRARQSVGIDNSAGQRVVQQKGRGVVVGIIDTGIDFRHQDFTVPGSGGRQTRIKALLDMTYYGTTSAGQEIPKDPGWNYTLPGGTSTIGHLYTEADINAALQVAKPSSQLSDSVKQRDKFGHGTHVAGTAAGNGLASPTPGTYAGMAPEADLVIVKATRQNDAHDNFGTDDIINGLKFIQQKAAELGEPFVINMSLGGHGGSPHDGTDPNERAVDNLVNSGAGRAVCIAAGNEGGSGIHAGGSVPAGGQLALNLSATDGGGATVNPQTFTLYYANSDRFSLTVRMPNGQSLTSGSFNGQEVQNPYLTIYNGTDDKQDADPSNDQSSLFVVFKDGAESLGSNWTFTLQGQSVTSGGFFNAWVDDGHFTNQVDDSRVVATPGTARGAITVGAYITRSASLPLGNIAPFSSSGPTADGRQKPDISAPGYYLYSARSTDVSGAFGTTGTGSNAPTDNTHYAGLLGTSMATPVVTGSVALILQSNPALTSEQMKDAIKASANSPFGGAPSWDAHYGFGRLNAAAAIARVSVQQTYNITGRVVNGSGAGIDNVNVALQGSASAQALTAGGGYYSFNNLAGGGNYTVTPTVTGYGFTPLNQSYNNLGANAANTFVLTVLNPIDDSQNFVTWQYRDFLSREPDAGGLGYWTGELNKCNSDPACLSQRRIDISAAFYIEIEYRETGGFVYRLYRAGLGRAPNYTEFSADRPQVVGGTDLEANKTAFASSFVQRAEFTQRYQSSTGAESFVDALIQSIKTSTGVDLTAQRASLINTYNTGGSQAQSRSLTLRAAIEDASFKQAVYNPSFVLMQYFGYLHRDPEQGGYDFWLNVLNNKDPNNFRGMVCSFITSAEYQLRFGSTVTRTNQDCR